MGLFGKANADELQMGAPAPTFALSDQEGKQHQLGDYEGRWVVLYFYPKDDTPGCTKEACAFRDEYKLISELDTQVLGMSVDTVDSHTAFAKKYSLPFPLLADEGGAVAKQYGSLTSLGPIKLAKRHSFIIDPEGKLAKIYRSVSPSSHSDEIISDLKTLRASRSD